MKPKPNPHAFVTTDPDRGGKYNIRSCNRCGLPETRTDIHTLPDDADIRAAENRRIGEHE